MEFLNIGGGELLIIVLLAIVLFGPEDILKIMRTIGEYTRKLQQMWAQTSAGLKGEFLTDEIIPEEVRETIKETQASVAELQKSFEEIKTATEADFNETKAAVEDVKTTLEEMSASVAVGLGEAPKALEATLKEPIARVSSPLAAPTDETSAPDTPQAEGEPLAAEAAAILITDTEPALPEVAAGQVTPATDSPLDATPPTECESPTITLAPETQGNGKDI